MPVEVGGTEGEKSRSGGEERALTQLEQRIVDRVSRLSLLEADADYRGAVVLALDCVDLAMEEEVRPGIRAWTCGNVGSTVSNIGMDHGDEAVLEQGRDVLRLALGSRGAPGRVFASSLYSFATATSGLVHLRMESADQGRAEGLWEHRDELGLVRRLLRDVAQADSAPPELRSRAATNLANALDDSGRWVEAYEWYVEALEIDPSNGNAAGNAALLLRRLIDAEGGDLGHLAAQHDRYLLWARKQREQTVEVAGEATAQLYDQMPLLDPIGAHLSHDGSNDDPYQQWVVDTRLALSLSAEGLGAHFEKWDSAAVMHSAPGPEHGVPAMFAMIDALRAEYVVARRLAYDGVVDLGVFGGLPAHDDPGEYGNMGDGTVAGSHLARLTLAQRAALDILDKLAVTVGHHLQTQDDPSRIDFRKFWTTGKKGPSNTSAAKRPELASDQAGLLHAVAELAFDLSEGGFYDEAQQLRNAGTHRVVIGNLEDIAPENVKESGVRIGTEHLANSALLALHVAKSAFLYVTRLLESHFDPDATSDLVPIHSMPTAADLLRGSRGNPSPFDRSQPPPAPNNE